MSTSSQQKSRFLEAEQQLQRRKEEHAELKAQYGALTDEMTAVR